MSRSRPSIVKLWQMQPGDSGDFFSVLAERTRGQTRDGKPFFTCRFRDAKRSVAFMVWFDGGLFDVCQSEWKIGQCFKIRATYGEHERYGPQLDITHIRRVNDDDRDDGFDPLEFVERSRFDPEIMFTELRSLVDAEIADEPLRRLVSTLLDRHAASLKRLPATQRHYHPFAGGWLEHTLSVTRSCLVLVDRYRIHYAELQPPLNRDLVVAGAALHEIGRVLEFDDGFPVQPTVQGRMVGHLFLGRDLVRDAAREIGDLNPELVQMLEHLIITHLSLPEWGSPKLPLIPECLILHHADDMDAKLEMYVRCLTRDTSDELFTERDPILNRQLYKGRTI